MLWKIEYTSGIEIMKILKYAGLIGTFVLIGFVFLTSKSLAYEVKAVIEGQPNLSVTVGSSVKMEYQPSVTEVFGEKKWEVIPTGLVSQIPPADRYRKSLEELILLAKENLARRLGVKIEEISLVLTEEKTWSDASLGCSEPGKAYAEVITPGYLIVLEFGGKEYQYHASYYFTVTCDSSLINTSIKIDPNTTLTGKITLDPALCLPGPCKILSVSQDQKQTELVQDGLKTKIAVAVSVGENGIMIDGQTSSEPIKLPDEVWKAVQTQVMPGSQSLRMIKMDLAKCEPQAGPERFCEENPALYDVETESQAKLLGIIPIRSTVKFRVGATSGEVLSNKKVLNVHSISQILL